MSIKASISWAVGAGKSTITKKVVEKLWCETADVWQIFRSRAVEKWMTINEYDKFVEKNPQEDIDMDNDFKKLVENSKKNIIVSRRMWFHFMPEILTIWLDVSDIEWAKRVMGDDRGNQEKKYKTINDALDANTERTKRLRERILKVYGVDFTDKNNYKVVIKTDGKTVEQVVDEVIKTIVWTTD